MESDRILGIAVESPVQWVRVRVPASADRPIPARGGPLFLAYSELTLDDGARVIQFAAPGDSDLGSWLDPSSWGPGGRVESDPAAAVVSLVGEGILSAGDRVREIAAILDEAGIAWRGIHTGSLSLSVVVAADRAEEAARALHQRLIEGR